jgi:isopenicillin N synthase-like dioxygenase
MFTLVWQSQTTAPALEVLNANAEWVPVPFLDNAFVVNVADFLQKITRGRWRSCVHRVRSGEERYSVPFFFSPDEDARVGGVGGEDEEEGDVVSVGEYFQRRLDVDRTTHLRGQSKE